MASKHVMQCDFCGKQAEADGYNRKAGWKWLQSQRRPADWDNGDSQVVCDECLESFRAAMTLKPRNPHVLRGPYLRGIINYWRELVGQE